MNESIAVKFYDRVDELRELREETGAVDFDLSPACVYSVTEKNRVNETGEETLFIREFERRQDLDILRQYGARVTG